jgi:hypothetical protein
MTFAVVLVVFAILSILLLWRFASSGSTAVRRLDDIVGHTRPVDVIAFSNLIDPDEELFLRSNLPPLEFRRIQRERMHAALEYVQGAAANAAVLLQLGQMAAQSPDLRVAQAGQQLVDTAVRVRLYALLATTKLYVRIAIPEANLSPVRLVERYERLSSLAGDLVAVQEPARAAQIAAAL